MTSLFDICRNIELKALLEDSSVTEVVINSFRSVFFERDGVLHSSSSIFVDEKQYFEFLENLVSLKQTTFNRERPFVELSLDGFRVSIVDDDVAAAGPILTLRRTGKVYKDIRQLFDSETENLKGSPFLRHEFAQLHRLVQKKANILVAGATSSGKTTLISNLIAEVPANERCVVLEDTDEICLPNSASVKLLTRPYINEQLPAIEFSELVKRSLRLRPDRILLGEIRGAEAFNFLMAVSAGHRGAISSLHAGSAHEALLRLEMLVQLGAPQWSISSIRKLLFFSVDAIVYLEKNGGLRQIKSISYVSSLEENGITLDPQMPPRLVEL